MKRDTRAKLTYEQVREIRERVAKGENSRALAKEYGVSTGHMSNIVKGRVWGHRE